MTMHARGRQRLRRAELWQQRQLRSRRLRDFRGALRTHRQLLESVYHRPDDRGEDELHSSLEADGHAEFCPVRSEDGVTSHMGGDCHSSFGETQDGSGPNVDSEPTPQQRQQQPQDDVLSASLGHAEEADTWLDQAFLDKFGANCVCRPRPSPRRPLPTPGSFGGGSSPVEEAPTLLSSAYERQQQQVPERSPAPTVTPPVDEGGSISAAQSSSVTLGDAVRDEQIQTPSPPSPIPLAWLVRGRRWLQLLRPEELRRGFAPDFYARLKVRRLRQSISVHERNILKDVGLRSQIPGKSLFPTLRVLSTCCCLTCWN